MKSTIASFYDHATQTISHVIHDGQVAAIIDPVADYDPKSGRTATHSAEKIEKYVLEHGLSVAWILETHAHADHLSAATWLKRRLGGRLGGRLGIGCHITEVQKIFKPIFHFGEFFDTEGSSFDHLFQDNETFSVGSLSAKVLHVPGHTPADVAYLFKDEPHDVVFVGDTLFMPDVGTARCDFPGGSASVLYDSIQRLLALPAATQLYLCHDYPAAESAREPRWQCSVAEQKMSNIHVRDGISKQAFVAMREERDRQLEMPTLIIPSLQVNLCAGELPPPESNGTCYLKIPVNVLPASGAGTSTMLNVKENA